MTLNQRLVYNWFQDLQYPAITGPEEDLAKALDEISLPPIKDPEKIRQILDELKEGGFITVNPINLR